MLFRSYSRVFGILAMIVSLGLAGGGVGFALLAEAYGNYLVSANVAGFLFLIASLSILLTGLLPTKPARSEMPSNDLRATDARCENINGAGDVTILN